MTSAPVIEVRGLSVAYKVFAKPADQLREALFGGTRHDTFWALRDVSLEVREGQRVGIVGPNGAGKSTLLQAIAGNLTPTLGSIAVRGKISSLLSLTPAWDLEQTGLENARHNLILQGVPRARLAAAIEDIVEFTDLGPYIHQPVKTYSSGMGARLSFAIATAIDPEILIIDEVLGTGDGYFAGRAARRMQAMCARGRALLFVSHATAAIRMMCDTALWVENGAVRMRGGVDEVVKAYEEDVLRQDEAANREGNRRRRALAGEAPTPEDVTDEPLWRLRLRPRGGGRLTGTHYVKAIEAEVDGAARPVPLEDADARRADTPAALDVHSCEWGRLFTRGEDECRTLLPRTGMRPGGLVLLRQPENVAPGARVPLRLVFDHATNERAETLSVDGLDVDSGAWRPFVLAGEVRGRDGWTRLTFEAELPTAAPALVAGARAAAVAAHRKPIEIIGVEVLVSGSPAAGVDELQPFTVRVSAEHHDAVAAASVNLNVVRSDGVYVFWQPSGLTSNIEHHLGRSTTDFVFDPNPFGPGEYEINAFVTDGFSWENCPPSDIYDRALGACHLKVAMRRPIPFGLVNLVVPTTTVLEPAAKTGAAQEAEMAPEGGAPSASASTAPLVPAVPRGDSRPELAAGAPAPLDLPAPFRGALAINSDVEWTSWAAQGDLMRLFADRGLDTAFSYWLYADAESTWRALEIDGTPSPEGRAAFELMRAGLLDTLHSVGGVMTGRGTPFARPEIARGYSRLEAEGVRARVYTNHGTIRDVQNVGGPWGGPRGPGIPIDSSNYHEGDLSDSASYHLDLTLGQGARYFWCDVDYTARPYLPALAEGGPDDALFAPQVARDGRAMLRFRRTHCGAAALPQALGDQVNAVLDASGRGFSVLYNHLGFMRLPDGRPAHNVPGYLPPAAFDALDRLATAQRAGDVLVTTTERLLDLALLAAAKPWHVVREGRRVVVELQREARLGPVVLPMAWADYAGLTLPVAADDEVLLALGTERREAERWSIGPTNYAGLRWRPLAGVGAAIDAAFGAAGRATRDAA